MTRPVPAFAPDPHAAALDARLAATLRPIAIVLGIMYLSSVVHRAADPALLASTPPTAIVLVGLFLGLGVLFPFRPPPPPLTNPILVLGIGMLTVETLGRGQAAAGVNLHWALIALGAVALRPRWVVAAAAAVIVPWALVAGLGLGGWAIDDWAFTLDMVTATALGMVVFLARRSDVLGALRAETALTASRDGYRRLMAVLQDGVLRLDGNGRISRMNPRAEALLGAREGDVAGLTNAEVPWRYLAADGSDLAPGETPASLARASGQPVSGVVIGLRLADGTVTWVTENAAPGQLGADGRPDEVIVSLTDVTPLREALEAASRSEARVRQVIDSAGDAILVLDERGRIVLANPAAASMTGFPQERILGTRALAGVQAADRAAARELIAGARRGDGGGMRTLRVRTTAGGTLWLEVRAHPVGDGSVELVARDITARKALEAERDALAASLDRAARMEAIGQLAGGVAHDFNNILTAILGHAELGRRDAADNPAVQADLVEIERAGERARHLTRQLLAFGRRSLLRPRAIRLGETAAGLESMLRRTIGEDVALVVAAGDEPGPVLADPGLLEHALVNLVINARDAMPAGGIVRITTGRPLPADALPPGDWAVIRVQDTGTGIAPEVLDRVFEPFFSTKPVGRGTGLGLAMVHGFVDQSGGHLRVATAPGAGTTVTIALPLAAAGGPDPWPDPAHGLAGTRPGTATCAGTVLVAEDEAVLRAIAERTLQLAGYEVLLAESGEAAMRVARDHHGRIDLLFTDIVMPGINGLALARELQARQADLRVLVTSGYTEDDVVRRGLSPTDLPFLPKPYTPTGLTEAVAGALR